LGEAGRVVLNVQVSATGAAEQVSVRTSSGSERLDQAALKAVKQWKFIPARRGDEAVAAQVLVPITFKTENE
jgi:protein TonB